MRCVILFGCSAAFAGAVPVCFGASPPTYTVTAVAAAPQYSLIAPKAVNDLGNFAAGMESPVGLQWGFFSASTGLTVLTPPAGSILSIVGVNNENQLAINTTAGPFVWSPSDGWSALPPDPNTKAVSASSINDNGDVAGIGFDGDGKTDDRTARTVVWHADGTLSEVRPKLEAFPAQITDSGGVLLTTYNYRSQTTLIRPAIVDPSGNFTKLRDLPGSGKHVPTLGVGLSMNEFAALNCYDTNLRDYTACYWDNSQGKGRLRSIGLYNSATRGISQDGTIVGSTGQPVNAFAWNMDWGSIDLRQHLAQGSPNFTSINDASISDNGVIAAVGYEGAEEYAVVLVPSAN